MFFPSLADRKLFTQINLEGWTDANVQMFKQYLEAPAALLRHKRFIKMSTPWEKKLFRKRLMKRSNSQPISHAAARTDHVFSSKEETEFTS